MTKYDLAKLTNRMAEDPASIYVDRILPRGTCSHYSKQKSFADTMRYERDQL